MQTVDITQVLVTLISTGGAILCAALGRRREKRVWSGNVRLEGPQRSGMSKWAVGMYICLCIAVINTGLLGWRLFQPKPAPQVAITYPADQSRVEQTETVRGSSEAIPKGQVIWVVVFSQPAGRFYPQNRPADMEADANWSSVAYVGVATDAGKKFDILAVLADVEAQAAFNSYLSEARDRSDWPGLIALPTGAVTHDRITVTRK